MRSRWTVIFSGCAIFWVCANPIVAAQPSGPAIESEKITTPSQDFGLGAPIGLQSPGEDKSETIPDAPDAGNAADLPQVHYDPAELPLPVRRLREQIIQAALTGDVDRLRPVFEANGGPPAMDVEGADDPIEQLRSLSGDSQGREILAILIEVLDAGYVHVDAGTPEEMYIWPYFARYPLTRLTGPQMVELFKLLTSGDYEDMKVYDAYLFYRVGIDPQGVWRYFLAGD